MLQVTSTVTVSYTTTRSKNEPKGLKQYSPKLKGSILMTYDTNIQNILEQHTNSGLYASVFM